MSLRALNFLKEEAMTKKEIILSQEDLSEELSGIDSFTPATGPGFKQLFIDLDRGEHFFLSGDDVALKIAGKNIPKKSFESEQKFIDYLNKQFGWSEEQCFNLMIFYSQKPAQVAAGIIQSMIAYQNQ